MFVLQVLEIPPTEFRIGDHIDVAVVVDGNGPAFDERGIVIDILFEFFGGVERKLIDAVFLGVLIRFRPKREAPTIKKVGCTPDLALIKIQIG